MVEHKKDESFSRCMQMLKRRWDRIKEFLSDPDNVRNSAEIEDWYKELYFKEEFSAYDMYRMTGLCGDSVRRYFKETGCTWTKGRGYFRHNKCAVWSKEDCNRVFDNCVDSFIFQTFDPEWLP